MNLIIISGAITSLDPKRASTSSEIFEINFVKQISSYVDNVIIITKARNSSKTGNINYHNIFLNYCMDGISIREQIIQTFYEHSLLNQENICLFWGYDFLLLMALISVNKKLCMKIVSYVYDTHLMALEKRTGIRRWCIQLYYNLGIRMLNSIDGILLVNPIAYKLLKLKIPYIITKIGYDSQNNHHEINFENNFKVCWSGSLEKHNGIIELLDALEYAPNLNINLDIIGDGDLYQEVYKRTQGDSRIKFWGAVDNLKLQSIIKQENLLLNLRNPNSVACNFSFPSKYLEYLDSGIPILTTRFQPDINFDDISYVIEDLTPDSIITGILTAMNSKYRGMQLALEAKVFLKSNYAWNNIIPPIVDFWGKLL